MKLLLTISLTLAMVALAVEARPSFTEVPSFIPKMSQLYLAMANVTETARNFATKLVADFPKTPEATEVLTTLRRYDAIMVEAYTATLEKPGQDHLERFIVEVAVADAHVHALDRRLRHPELKPQDDKTKVHTYAVNVLKLGKGLLKEMNQRPGKVTLADWRAVTKIIADLKFRLKEIESSVELSNIVDTVAYLALDNEKLVQIGKKLGKPTA